MKYSCLSHPLYKMEYRLMIINLTRLLAPKPQQVREIDGDGDVEVAKPRMEP